MAEHGHGGEGAERLLAGVLGEAVPVVENRALVDVIAVIRGHTGFGTARQQPQPVGEEHGSAVAAGR